MVWEAGFSKAGVSNKSVSFLWQSNHRPLRRRPIEKSLLQEAVKDSPGGPSSFETTYFL